MTYYCKDKYNKNTNNIANQLKISKYSTTYQRK